MKTGVLFAGQGSQYPGMGRDFYEQYPAFREMFDLLTEEEKKAAFEGPEDELKKTELTQPVMLAFACGVYRVLCERLPELKVDLAAGLSLGEYSALTAAGVFMPDQAVDIIRLRGRLMAERSKGIDTVMCAVIGLDAGELNGFCEEASLYGFVEIANYNCPGQMVLSGDEAGVAACEELIRRAGKGKMIRLAVSGPFHTSYMEPVGQALAERFREESFGDMQIPVLFNYIGDVKPEEMTIAQLLAKQVYSSVRFEDTIRNMIARGIDNFIEIGPGKALSGFVKKTDRSVKTMKIDTVDDLEKTIERITQGKQK